MGGDISTMEREHEGPTLPVVFKWHRSRTNRRVIVSGTFNNWRNDLFFYQWDDGQFYAVVDVPIGAHEYKYCVLAEDEYDKDVWMHDPEKPWVCNEFGTYNNVLRVDEKHVRAFRSIDVERMILRSGKGFQVGPDGTPMHPSGIPEIPSDNPETPSDDPETPSDNPETPSDNPETPSDNPETPCDNPETPSDNPETPSDNPETPSDNPETPSGNPETPSSPPRDPYNLPALQHQLRELLDRKYKSIGSMNPMFNEDHTVVRWEHCFGAVSDDMAVRVSNHSFYHKHSTTIFCAEAKKEPTYSDEDDE